MHANTHVHTDVNAYMNTVPPHAHRSMDMHTHIKWKKKAHGRVEAYILWHAHSFMYLGHLKSLTTGLENLKL